MEANDFDALTRSLTAGLRRRVLVAVVAAALASLLGNPDTAAHDALKKCKKIDDKARRKRCVKRAKAHHAQHATPFSCAGQSNGTSCGASPAIQCCAGVCVDTARDERHCGACGKRCQLNATCVAGVCRCINDPMGAACPPGSGYSCCQFGGPTSCICSDANNPGNFFVDPVSCTGILGCPPDQQCIGPDCQACCPRGATCDTSTGTCLPP
jgi:hypothetical protein